MTYLFLFELKEGNSIGEELDVVLGTLLSSPLLSEGVADLHRAPIHHVVFVLRVVLLLQSVHVVLHHLLLLLHVHSCEVLLVVLLLVWRSAILRTQLTVRH